MMNTRRRTRETQIQLRRIAKEKKERNSQKRERNQKGFFQTRFASKECRRRALKRETKRGGKKKFRVSVKMWGALSGASACRTEIENVTRRFKKTAFRVCESASVAREMRQYCRER